MKNQLDFFSQEKDNKELTVEPQKVSFSDWEIIGHKTQVEYLKSNINNKDLAHAYLFSGESNIGKRKIAKAFVKSLLCETPKRYCGKCPSCLQAEKGTHPDLFYLGGKDSIKIEEVRELIARISLKPFNSRHKTAIIDNAERLTIEAANALLKTLEEPPGQAVIILIAKNSSMLLETIVSRARVVKFFKTNSEELLKILKENNIKESDKEFILGISFGRAGKVYNLLNNPEKLEEIKNYFKEFIEIFKKTRTQDLNYSAKLAKIYESEPEKIPEMLNYWIVALRDIINSKSLNNYKSFMADYFGVKYSSDININEIIFLTKYLNKIKEIITKPGFGFNIKLICDLMVLKLRKVKIING